MMENPNMVKSKDLKTVDLRSYNYRDTDLPVSSYRSISGNREGEFIPFMLVGPAGLGEHKQLNWTNLFLFKKLGSWQYENQKLIDAVLAGDTEKIESQLSLLNPDVGNIIRPKPSIILDNTPDKIKLEGITQKLNSLEKDIGRIIAFLSIPPKPESSIEQKRPRS